jgi:hypothetical protein
MAEYFLQYKTTPYLFDTRQLKLFRLKNSNRIEINNPDTLRKVRLGSIEINREYAYVLALETEN